MAVVLLATAMVGTACSGDADAPEDNPVIEREPAAAAAPGRILADASAARAAGARFVVVSMRWGTEYQIDPSPEQRALARQLLESPDVDLILGAHAHVVQPIEKIGNEYVV